MTTKYSPDIYSFLRSLGEDIFSASADEINTISEEHIRTKKEDFRQEVDFNEMCMAMGVLYYKMMEMQKTQLNEEEE